MFRTVFSKMFTVYMCILLGSLMIIGIVFSNSFKTYFMNYTEDVMIKQAEQIAAEYEKAAFTGVIDTNQINFEIQVIDKYLDATIWIVDKTGEVMIVSGEDRVGKIEEPIFQKAIDSIFNEEVVRIESGFEQYFKEPMLSIGFPMVINKDVQRGLFIHTSMSDIIQIIEEVRLIFMKILIIASLVAFIGVYILSLYITKPIQVMNEAAKVVARGNFKKKMVLEEREDEIGQLANSFNYMASELDKIEEGRQELIENISHDLRTPLTSVTGFVQAIMDGTIAPENQNQYLQIVLDEAERMNKMTNDILNLTKVENADIVLDKEAFDINIIIRETLLHFKPVCLEKNNYVEIILAEDESFVMADEEKIIRVLHNLLENAFKFAEQNGRIVIETTYEKGKVNVSVSNTGEYIPPEDIKYIWDRFHKADKSRGSDKVGTGIGLAIVKGVIRQHDEEVYVTSEEGKLTTFTFTLAKAKKEA